MEFSDTFVTVPLAIMGAFFIIGAMVSTDRDSETNRMLWAILYFVLIVIIKLTE